MIRLSSTVSHSFIITGIQRIHNVDDLSVQQVGMVNRSLERLHSIDELKMLDVFLVSTKQKLVELGFSCGRVVYVMIVVDALLGVEEK